MKIHQGKTARQIRKRELVERLLSVVSALDPQITAQARILILELFELSVIDSSTTTKPRRRK